LTWPVLEQKENNMYPNRRPFIPLNTIYSPSRNNHRIPSFEGLEVRVVLSPTIYTVDSTADGSSTGTLRWAITQANANKNSAGSTIEFSSTVFNSPQTIRLTEGTLDLTGTAGPEVIQGPPVGVTINGSGDAKDGVFYVEYETPSVHASFSGLTITGGNANSGGLANEGGGISNLGVLTLNNCTVEGNYAHLGGGISSSDQLTLDDCTIAGNTSHGNGGGISSSGALSIVNSTISGNTAEYGSGGGILEDYPEEHSLLMTLTGCTISGNSSAFAALFSGNDATLTNCTISGNTGSDGGGGVYLEAAFTLDACTISANSTASGAGCGLDVVDDASGARTLEDTLIAGNTAGSPASPSDIAESSAGLVTGSFNLIGPGGSAGIVNGSSGNIVLTSLAGLQLGPLASNGGPTQTMALLPGSLGINNGTTISGLTTDQRGDPLDTPAADIGAYQSQGYSWSVVAGSTPQSANGGSGFKNPLAVMLTQNGTNSPVPGTTVTFTVNPGSKGASAYLSSTTAVSLSSGVASVTATAYDVAGSFTVTATAGNLAPITFDLTVTDLSQPVFSNLTAPTITYGTASVDLGGTIAAGSQIPSGDSVAVTLDGVTQNATIGSDGSFSTGFATSTLAASATPYTVSYAFDSEGNFESASATSKLTVNRAAAQIIVTPYSSTYNGAAHSATATATGVAGVNLSADINLTGTTHTNAGTYTDTWTFTDPTGNYTNASGTITDTISASQGPGGTSPTGSAATTTLLTGAGVSVYGQSAGVTVQVTATAPGTVVAGVVELLVDGAVWTTATLDATGQTVISTAGISVGEHSIVAVYMGTASDGRSQSQPLAWRVNPAATTVLFTTSPVFSKKGKVRSVSLISQVEVNSPGTGIPTGSITLFRGKNHRMTSITLNNGETSIRLAANQVKGQKFFVDYSGSGDYSASTSPVLSGKSILSQRSGHAG
jgi:Bacterial Ig-like domain (group 3)/Right handed beta helix region